MPEVESRPLHLHTLDSLVADLVSGRPIQTAANEHFALPNERARSALEWYRRKRPVGWASKVSAQDGEELVDAILKEPPELPALPARLMDASNRRLRLKKLEAHRFAGLHKFGTPTSAPRTYVHEFTSAVTLFEGRNGSGKTSLLNAIIWALTGEMLRPQREPESAEDFDCWAISANQGDERTALKLSPLTPMPNVEQYRPEDAWVPADTWVELTFTDEAGKELPVIRRSQSRTSLGKLKESPPNLTVLGIDPIAVRIGSVMPGLLPLIKVGSESELGHAVSQLTGLSALVDLAEHVRRSKARIDKEFVKAKTEARDRADLDYSTAKEDLERTLAAHPSLKPAWDVPPASEDKKIESVLEDTRKHLETAKTAAFESARKILGDRFDPANSALLSDVEKNTVRALERVSQPRALASVARLGALRQLTREQLDAAETKIHGILAEAKTLDRLARNPSAAARTRLYARIAAWAADHPDPRRKDDTCVVCSSSLDSAIDPVTGRPVKLHLREASLNASLLSQTLRHWAQSVQGELMRSLPEALRAEMALDLPAHPCDLLRTAFVNELFAFDPFSGALRELKTQTAAAFDDVVKQRAPLGPAIAIEVPAGCDVLREPLARLELAIRFARWRHANEVLARNIVEQVLGRVLKAGERKEKTTLTGKLLDLEETVKAARPVSDALLQCERLKQHLKGRRAAEGRLLAYATASSALEDLIGLGNLADQQVDELRKTLRQEAAAWRSRIYLGAYPDTAHELVDADMGRKGELDLVVRAGGISAPAQHVSNASALRASLVAFFLAFWEHVLKTRGGLMTLVLDDPQELLDDENRERLAAALVPLAATGAQLIVTSYDPRFCARVSRLPIPNGIEHLEVHPATRQQPVVRTTPLLPVIQRRKALFDADRNQEEPARDFADGCRVFFEAKLGDMFDDPAHAMWAIANPDPTLATFVQRLRPIVKAGPEGMFSAHIFRRFVEHAALADGSAVITLMNKAHHGRRGEIRAADVAQCADELNDLLEIVEAMGEECYRWMRRDRPTKQLVPHALPALVPLALPALNIQVCPDLAAFTRYVRTGESQEIPGYLDPSVFGNVATYYLRRPNFGFAAPAGSLAIVEAVPGPAADRRLVIARHGDVTYARRLVRGASPNVIGLTAEVPDPRTRSPKTIVLSEVEVAIHQVVGIIFDHSLTGGLGKDEAVLVDASAVLKGIEIAFRVVDESAVPLALEKQVVLGGARIELSQLGRHKDALVALTLDDGATIFKRVGAALPDELDHLVQFESIGGLGSSLVLAVGRTHAGFRSVTSARVIIGVLYHG